MPASPTLVSTRPLPWLWSAGLVATSWLATGLAGALVVMGALALAVASRRLFPTLAGPALWAVAVLLELGFLSVSAMALPFATADHLTQRVALTVLALPVLAGVVAAQVTRAAVSRRPNDGHRTPEDVTGALADSSAIGLAPVAVFTTAWLVRSRGQGFSAAWAMSGDARNHVTLIWQVIAQGGVTRDDLNRYPLMVDALAALLSAAGGRAELAPGHQLIHDASASASTFLLAAAALAALFAAAILETASKRSAAATAAAGHTIVIVSATLGGLLVTTALVTGTALYGGALSAYGAAPVAMAVVVLSLRAMNTPSAIILLLISCGGLLLLTAWSVLALLVPPLMALVAVRGSLTRPRPTFWLPGVIGASAVAAVPLVVFIAKRAEVTSTLVTSGTVVGPAPLFLLVLVLVSAGLVAAKGPPWSRAAAAVPLLLGLAGAVVIGWLMALGPGPLARSYYATKMLWLVESLLVWVLFVPIVALVLARDWPTPARWTRRSTAVIGAAALLACIGLVSPLTNPVRSAWNGWNQPRAAGIARLERLGDAGRPFVFWHWTDGGSQAADGKRIDRNLNDRILNFWSAALMDRQASQATPTYDPALLPGGAIGWAVNAYGEVDQLCVLAKAVPELVVVTRDRSLPRELATSCAGPTPSFRLD